MSAVLTEPATPQAPGAVRHIAWGPWALAGLVLAFLGVFLLVPIGLVIYTAFVTETGALTLGHFSNFFGQGLLRESFVNSLSVALASVFFASAIAIPLAYLTVRFEFRGALLIQTLGVLPLIMPPFVGAERKGSNARGQVLTSLCS